MTPPWSPFHVVRSVDSLRDGATAELQMKLGPVKRRWLAEHRDCRPNRQFRDVMVEGPFKRWNHLHRFEPEGVDASFLEDRVEYELPAGVVGRKLAGRRVRDKLDELFSYRHRVLGQDLDAHRRFADQGPKRILVTGASGLVGRELVAFLTSGGHEVWRLSRSKDSAERTIAWDPDQGQLDAAQLEGFDAVVHLAGENIASGRWTTKQKARIRESRVRGTTLLATALAACRNRPSVLVSASAIGFYGDRGDEKLDDRSPPGKNFLADVCRAWETATEPASRVGMRVVHARFGIVLSPRGGALAKMLTPFQFGAGGNVGSGNQWWSWVAIDDVIGAIHHAMFTADLKGTANVVAPQPVTNAEFTKCLGRVLHRPTVLPMPALAARLALGQMADELLLASAHVWPRKLEATGYEFHYPDLTSALAHVLGRPA